MVKRIMMGGKWFKLPALKKPAKEKGGVTIGKLRQNPYKYSHIVLIERYGKRAIFLKSREAKALKRLL